MLKRLLIHIIKFNQMQPISFLKIIEHIFNSKLMFVFFFFCNNAFLKFCYLNNNLVQIVILTTFSYVFLNLIRKTNFYAFQCLFKFWKICEFRCIITCFFRLFRFYNLVSTTKFVSNLLCIQFTSTFIYQTFRNKDFIQKKIM